MLSAEKFTRSVDDSIVAALLQPTPATYGLFDNRFSMREGTTE